MASARLSTSEAGVGASFEVGDATTWAGAVGTVPDVVVVNPPRRGISELAGWLEGSRRGHGDLLELQRGLARAGPGGDAVATA